jgi:hypothetical protein
MFLKFVLTFHARISRPSIAAEHYFKGLIALNLTASSITPYSSSEV